MVARPIGNGNTLRVEGGLYEKVRTRELKLAFAPDPRLSLIRDSVERERVAATAPRHSPTVLFQVEELLARRPVRLPRWLLGGHVTCPEAKGWAPYEDRRHQWFVLGPEDVLRPA
jgi:hypothetical protein